jgi:hypothetical protein
MTALSCRAACGWRAICGRGVSRLGQETGARQSLGDDPSGGRKPAGNEGRIFRGDGQSRRSTSRFWSSAISSAANTPPKSSGSGLVLNREETFCVMINEEDHLRMQALRPGLQLKQAWNAIDQAGFRAGEAGWITPSTTTWVI